MLCYFMKNIKDVPCNIVLEVLCYMKVVDHNSRVSWRLHYVILANQEDDTWVRWCNRLGSSYCTPWMVALNCVAMNEKKMEKGTKSVSL